MTLFTFREFAGSNVKKVLRVLAATMALLFVCLPLFSQNSSGIIQGTVFDQTGGSHYGATVMGYERRCPRLARTLTTDSAGAVREAQNLNPARDTGQGRGHRLP